MSAILSVIQIQLTSNKIEQNLGFIRSIGLELYFKGFAINSEEGTIPVERSLNDLHLHSIFSYWMMLNQHRGILARRHVYMDLVKLQWLQQWVYYTNGVEQWNDKCYPTNFKFEMEQGQNIVFIQGGFKEATLTSRVGNRVYFQSRKCFIKYTFQNGYKIYPKLIFSENQKYYYLKNSQIRLFLNRFKVIRYFFWSRFGLLPKYSHEIHTVIENYLTPPTY